MTDERTRRREHLSARPGMPSLEPVAPGLHSFDGVNGSHTLLVPSALPDAPVPLVVYLHGSGSDPVRSLPVLEDQAERLEFLLLIPKSFHYTWDVILGGFGPDVTTLDTLLRRIFDRFAVDPDRVVLAGFSDGASYALALGLMNGSLFRRIHAYSPGFRMAGEPDGHPAVFVSHGVDDPVLPIDRCSRRIVPELRAEGYDVDYREFAGGHHMPRDLIATSFGFLGDPGPAH